MLTRFSAQYSAFSYLFALFISLTTLPLLGWHYWTTLEGFGVLAIGGLAITDCVLWFSSLWACRAQTSLMKVGALTVKFVLAGVMIFSACIVVVVLRADRAQIAQATRQTEARLAEIAERGRVAADLAQTPGGRAAAREMAKMETTSAAPSLPSQAASGLPVWLTAWGIYLLPPFAALLGALALSICATVAAVVEDGALFPAPVARVAAASGTAAYRRSSSPAPVAVSPAPVAVSPAPVAVSPAPVAVSPAPAAVSPAPAAVSPAPVAVSPAPAAVSPAPAQNRRVTVTSNSDKPPVIPGHHWRKDGAGWILKKTVYNDQGQRRFVYVAHLSRSAWVEMQKSNDPAQALKRWVKQAATHKKWSQ